MRYNAWGTRTASYFEKKNEHIPMRNVRPASAIRLDKRWSLEHPSGIVVLGPIISSRYIQILSLLRLPILSFIACWYTGAPFFKAHSIKLKFAFIRLENRVTFRGFFDRDLVVKVQNEGPTLKIICKRLIANSSCSLLWIFMMH